MVLGTGPQPAVIIGTDGVNADDVWRVAVERTHVAISPEVGALIDASSALVDRAATGDRLIYGLNTGLGSRRNVRVERDDMTDYQTQIVAAHAGGLGPPLSEADTRAAMMVRVVGAARGGSGLHRGAVEALLDMLNAGVTPVVPEVGSVGASDLMHMAAIALVVIGRGHAVYNGSELPGAEALAGAGITPFRLRPKDGLGLVSANGACIGMAALTLRRAGELIDLADRVAALNLEAITGNPSPVHTSVAAAKPLRGQMTSAANIRAHLEGSYLLDADTATSVQDVLSFRTVPQVHGALRDQLTFARKAVDDELISMDDNPLVSVGDGLLLSNGNFHPMLLAISFEGLRLALAHAGAICERRIHHCGLALLGPHKIETPGIDESGMAGMPMAYMSYSASAVLARLTHLANPVTLNCPPLDSGVEDHSTLSSLAVTMARESLDHLESLLVIEAIFAVRVLGDRADVRLGRGTFRLRQAVDEAMSSLHRRVRVPSAADAVSAVRERLRQSLEIALPPFELGSPGPMRDRLNAAALSGSKTATSALRAMYHLEGEPLPQPGQRFALMGSDGETLGVVETIAVRQLRLADVDDEIAYAEGEGFADAEAWRVAHQDFWAAELAVLSGGESVALDDDTVVVVETFRIVG